MQEGSECNDDWAALPWAAVLLDRGACMRHWRCACAVYHQPPGEGSVSGSHVAQLLKAGFTFGCPGFLYPPVKGGLTAG